MMKKITLFFFLTVLFLNFGYTQTVVFDEDHQGATINDAGSTLGYELHSAQATSTVQTSTISGFDTAGNQVLFNAHASGDGDLYLFSDDFSVSEGDEISVSVDVSTTNGVHVVMIALSNDPSEFYQGNAVPFQPDQPASSTNGTQAGANGRIVEAHNSGGTPVATTTTATFTVPSGYSIGRIRIYNFGSSNTMEVDNFVITKTAVLSIDGLSKFNFSSYPNPAKDWLRLSASNKIEKIEIYSLLGQQIMSKGINSREGNINIASLSKGIYVNKVYIGNTVGTYKFIKE